MDDKQLVTAIDITIDRLLRTNADQQTVAKALRELLTDWTPDDALRQHRAD
jgi:hypothetical protein